MTADYEALEKRVKVLETEVDRLGKYLGSTPIVHLGKLDRRLTELEKARDA
jgi:hypothetical protein